MCSGLPPDSNACDLRASLKGVESAGPPSACIDNSMVLRHGTRFVLAIALATLFEVLLIGASAEVCAAGCGLDECCCMYCGLAGTGEINFDCETTESCAAQGGQCKAPAISAYSRPGPSVPAPPIELSSDPVEQVHLIGGAPDEVTVAFVSKDLVDSVVAFSSGLNPSRNLTGEASSYTVLMMPTGTDNVPGHGVTPGQDLAYCDRTQYHNPDCYYTSPFVHMVTLKGLQPSTTYKYRPSSSQRWRSFRTPPAVGQPITFGVLADVGRTNDSLATMQHLHDGVNARTIDTILLPGDLSYADGYAPAWDEFGRLSEFLFEGSVTAFGPGNHEVASGMENFANYVPRYGWPGRGAGRPLWYSFEAGLAHVIMLCSYCDYSRNSLQYRWLADDLSRLNRTRTPWLVVTMHVPFYSSNAHHSSTESDAMKASMEDLLYTYKTDVILSGHVHAYERTGPMYKYAERCDGPVQLVIGDGGNKEGPACPWNATTPNWSKLREFSFGHGTLALRNRTHALWQWHRNQDGQAVHADSAWILPSASRCPGSRLPPSGVEILV